MSDKDFVVRNGLTVNTNLIFAANGKVGINNNAPTTALTVAGASDISGNVSIAGISTLQSNLQVTGHANVTGTANVSGIVNFGANVIMTGGRLGVNVASPTHALNVVGSANITVDIIVGGNLVVAGSQVVTGTTTFAGNLIPSSNSNFLGNTIGLWSVVANTVTTTGNMGVKNSSPDATLAVTGTANISGNVSMLGITTANSLSVTNTSTFYNTFTLNANQTITGNLTSGVIFIEPSGRITIGNSTINAVSNASSIKVSNSTSNITFSIPASTDVNNDKFFAANGVYGFPTTVPESPYTANAFTLALTDAGKMVTASNTTVVTITLPNNSTIAYLTGTRIDLLQTGAGQVVIANAAGVTLNSSGTKKKLTSQYSGATLWKQGTDIWYLVGDISL